MPRQIVIIRALNGLGDLLCGVPALRALRWALPEARIALVGMPWAASFVARFSRYLDELIELPGYPGLPEREPQIERFPSFLAEMHGRRFDLAIQMHGSGTISNPLTVLLGARVNAGFYLPGAYCPDAERFLPYPEHEPEIWRHLRLMEFLGVPLQGNHLEFPLVDGDFEELAALEDAATLRPGDYICLHAGASVAEKRWPAERFAAVGDWLARQGIPVVLTGTAAEMSVAEEVAQSMKCPPVNLAGRTSLGALAALLSQARLLISNDTGVVHLAAALGLPSVVIFSIADPARWAPLDRRRHRSLRSPATEPVALGEVLAEVEAALNSDQPSSEYGD